MKILSIMRQPSLVRRLIVAQVSLLLLLWLIALLLIVGEGGDTTPGLQAFRTYQAALRLADDTAGQPAMQQQALHLVDTALREEFDGAGLSDIGPVLLVWQGARLVYRTPGAPDTLRDSGHMGLETVVIHGYRYRARSIHSARSDTRLLVAVPTDRWDLFMSLSSHGYVLLPLIFSLPLLPLPAWWSIRMALRPWRQVVQEVAARGPADLTPLSARPPHRELIAMVDSVNALLQRVNRSAQRERSFIADAAHELRTPLAAMRVNAEALQAQTSNPVQRELLNGILSSANRAGRLVGQLLHLMRSDATGGEQHIGLELDVLLQDRLAVLSGLAAQGAVELELAVAEPLRIMGQREGLVSLVDNLVENAIKYSPPQAVVRVSLQRAAGQALLLVEDQGPGIAPELRLRVFDRFFRDPRQTQSGSGLGLAIAASVAASHGGSIVLDDAEGGGLLVRVQLPLA